MSIREARLPADEPAILSFIDGLQDYEAAFEPDRRRDPDFAVEHWREFNIVAPKSTAIMLIAEDAGGRWAGPSPMTRMPNCSWSTPERRHGFLAEISSCLRRGARAWAGR